MIRKYPCSTVLSTAFCTVLVVALFGLGLPACSGDGGQTDGKAPDAPGSQVDSQNARGNGATGNGAGDDGHAHTEGDGEHAPAGFVPGSYEDWCGSHQVPESACTRCNASLIPAFQATGDWCAEHGLPESQCRTCNPNLVIQRPPKSEGE